jgi:hypothetical protein
MTTPRPSIPVPCERCGKEFLVWPARLKAGRGRWCSRACRYARSLHDEFMVHVDKTSECWIWTAGKTSHGYGATRFENRSTHAHRVAYHLFVAPVMHDPRVLICHRCDNPICVRPEHLFAGTHVDNMRDMAVKGRASRRVQPWRQTAEGRTKLAQIRYRDWEQRWAADPVWAWRKCSSYRERIYLSTIAFLVNRLNTQSPTEA